MRLPAITALGSLVLVAFVGCSGGGGSSSPGPIPNIVPPAIAATTPPLAPISPTAIPTAPPTGTPPVAPTAPPTGTPTVAPSAPPTTGPTATPAPTPTPTPTPMFGALTVSPSTLSFTTAGTSQTFTASEGGYTGAFTATSTAPNSCSGIATFTASGAGPSASFTVTSVAAGQCQIAVTDTLGKRAVVSVTVTTTSGTISGVGRPRALAAMRLA